MTTRLANAFALTPISSNGPVSASSVFTHAAYYPPESFETRASQVLTEIAYVSGDNVSTHVSNVEVLVAFRTTPPNQTRETAWTFVLDGHRFYVLPLGEEGDWAYDTTTQEWCQLQTQGFNGMNFTVGVMWGLRIMGGDSLNNFLLEIDPNQPFDDGWREVEHIVTGGIPTRGRYNIGVSNFTLTASVGDDQNTDMPVSLAFSDDNGVTWSPEMDIPLTDASTQTLIWNSLGSFSAPGRVFRVTDYAGPVRFDGADCVLSIPQGADSGENQDGQTKQ